MNKIEFDTSIIGCQYVYLPQCHSTNEYIQQMLSQNLCQNGALVITHNQTKGKGQMGNSWQAEAGKNLTFSIYLTDYELLANDQFILSQAISLALYEALMPICVHLELKIKWPNDILVLHLDQWKKVAGILIENQLHGANVFGSVVGIGININQTQFDSEKASSLGNLLGTNLDLSSILIPVCSKIEHWYLQIKNKAYGSIQQKYTQALFGYGEHRNFLIGQEQVEGIILGVNPQGKICIQISDAIKYFNLKEITFMY